MYIYIYIYRQIDRQNEKKGIREKERAEKSGNAQFMEIIAWRERRESVLKGEFWRNQNNEARFKHRLAGIGSGYIHTQNDGQMDTQIDRQIERQIY